MFATYLLIRLVTLPFAYLPYRVIAFFGKHLGLLAYYLIPKYRKRALSNLALSDLKLSNAQVRETAKKSLQSLMITALEYPRLIREKDIDKIARIKNPEKAFGPLSKGQGVIFFCGHQANWEILFLIGSKKFKGTAIGRPIKNRYLYNWVQSMRTQFGGKIVQPRKAIKQGMRALKNGEFFGIVGDQGMPDSGFSSPFLGRKAWTSPLPALLAHRTGCRLFVASNKRTENGYEITFSEPILPDPNSSLDTDVKRLMQETLAHFEKTVRACPEQWMWIHNRWKQQTTKALPKPLRYDSIALFLPEDENLIKTLPEIRSIYPTEHLCVYLPQSFAGKCTLDAEIHPYNTLQETLVDDLRFKCILNFTGDPRIEKHYRKKSAQSILQLKTLLELKNRIGRA